MLSQYSPPEVDACLPRDKEENTVAHRHTGAQDPKMAISLAEREEDERQVGQSKEGESLFHRRHTTETELGLEARQVVATR